MKVSRQGMGGDKEGGAEVDREYNLTPAVHEVVFSQQAVGMIPGGPQCRERDHREDIPILGFASQAHCH